MKKFLLVFVFTVTTVFSQNFIGYFTAVPSCVDGTVKYFTDSTKRAIYDAKTLTVIGTLDLSGVTSPMYSIPDINGNGTDDFIIAVWTDSTSSDAKYYIYDINSHQKIFEIPDINGYNPAFVFVRAQDKRIMMQCSGYKIKNQIFDLGINATTILDENIPLQPNKTILHQNFPNPFNPSTKINYQLSKPSDINISVFDIRGRLVKELVYFQESIGSHEHIWDGRDNAGIKVSSGVYYYQLKYDGGAQAKKMLLLK